MEDTVRCPECETGLIVTLTKRDSVESPDEFSGWEQKENVVREEIRDRVLAIEVKGGNKIFDTIYEEAGALFDTVVMEGTISDFTLNDMVQTLPATTAIIKIAEDEAWVGDSDDKWYGGASSGFLASVAYNSLINILVHRIGERDNSIDIVT